MKYLSSASECLRLKITPLLVVSVFIIYTLICFGFYLERTLGGDINNHILAGEMFGTPADLQARGIKPLYVGEGQTGWDGQFYYYMANDLLGLKDTAKHIDAPSYRYQRIGMSLYAALTSKVFLQDWVSPGWYLGSYFLLLIAATYTGALVFLRLNASPAWILLWALSPGTQFTLFNALPDAAADGFLILGIAALLARRYALAIVPLSFAALSREVYVLFPSAVLLFHLIGLLRDVDGKLTFSLPVLLRKFLIWQKFYLLLIPGVIAILWQLYIVSHFGVRPSEQAHGILGLPFFAWYEYFVSGVSGHHKLVGVGLFAYAEAASLLAFVGVLILAVLAVFRLSKAEDAPGLEVSRGLSFAVVLLVVMYSCFGPTVIMHYTGYFKALALFFFVVPLLYVLGGAGRYTLGGVFFVLFSSLVLVSTYNLLVRVLPSKNFDEYTNLSKITETRRVECFGDYRFKVDVLGLETLRGGLISSVFGGGEYLVVRLKLTNTGSNDLVSTRDFGSVHMSYHWVDASGKVILDGIRSAIPGKILPGQSSDISVVSFFPPSREGAILKLSPVQEGCAWFYMSAN